MGQIINLIMNAFARGRGVTEYFQLFSIPAWLVLGIIVFMLCVGLVVVYLPARRASRINPIDALRRE
jgi:ABC-type antimicrobial peptide transport system permease subunit